MSVVTNDDIRNEAHSLIDRRFAVLLANRGGNPEFAKVPFDPRPKAARLEKGLKSGAYAWVDDHQKLDAWMDTAEVTYEPERPLNVGVSCGYDNLAVIDLDTEAAVRAFADLACKAGDEALPLTTLSPGKREADDTWSHRGGGHIWIRMPDSFDYSAYPAVVSLTNASGCVQADGVDVKLQKSWVLAPPSERAEGAYQWAGEPYLVHDCPDWLAEQLENWNEARRSRRPDYDAESRTPEQQVMDRRIAAWSERQDLNAVMDRDGWTQGGADSCGCEIWARPGRRQGTKSATRHEAGCVQNNGDVSCLQLWTSDASSALGAFAVDRGIQRLNVLQMVAAVDYHGDMREAMRWEQLLTQRGVQYMVPTDVAEAVEDNEDVSVHQVSVDWAFLTDRSGVAPSVREQDPTSDTSEESSRCTTTVSAVPFSDEWKLPSDEEATERFSWDIDEVWLATDEFTLPGLSVLEQWNGLGYFNRGKKWVITPGQLYAGLVFGDVPADIANAVVELWGTNLELAMSYYKDYLASLSRTELREQYGTF